MKKQALFVSYHFPPDSEVGGRRIARLASFLHERGWDVGVLTVRERHYQQRDSSFSQEGLTVYRTAMIESVRFLFGGVRGTAADYARKEGRPVERSPQARRDRAIGLFASRSQRSSDSSFRSYGVPTTDGMGSIRRGEMHLSIAQIFPDLLEQPPVFHFHRFSFGSRGPAELEVDSRVSRSLDGMLQAGIRRELFLAPDRKASRIRGRESMLACRRRQRSDEARLRGAVPVVRGQDMGRLERIRLGPPRKAPVP